MTAAEATAGPHWSQADRDLAARCDAARVSTRDALALILIARGVTLRAAARIVGAPLRAPGVVTRYARRAALAICDAEDRYSASDEALDWGRSILDCIEQSPVRRDHGPPIYYDGYGQARELVTSSRLVTADDIAAGRLLEIAVTKPAQS